jgi:predicted SprT family Zn-dependent metalloprotease
MLAPDLNWLPHSLFKGIEYPKVVYEAEYGQSYGGYYTHGSNILVVVASPNEHYWPDTIAHEFKHYLQWIANTINPLGSDFQLEGSYEQSIRKYFRTQPDEYEALLFAHKYAKCELNDWWLRKLVLNK